jgi:hypothetical protein
MSIDSKWQLCLNHYIDSKWQLCLNHYKLWYLKQKEGESLQYYTKWFKTSRDVLGRPIILSKYMTTMKDYDEKNTTKVAECKEQAFQQ